MNKITLKNKKFIALVAAMLMLASALAGCKQEPAQETQTVETTAATEAITDTTMETMPTEPEVVETLLEVESPEAGSITYAEYLELTIEEQQAYYENFASADDFLAWMNEAKAEYDAATEPAETFDSGNSSQEETGPVEVAEGIFVEEDLEDWE